MAEPATAGFQLSPQQKHVWDLQNGQSGVSQVAILLDGAVDVPLLKASVRAVVQRHEILRTRFQRNTGMKYPFQVVSDQIDLNWSETELPAAEFDQPLIERLFATRREIDASVTPNFYCDLTALAPARHVLVLSLPGLCADAASLNQLIFEIRDQYASKAQGESDPLQYADYSEWQNELLQSSENEALTAREYWKKSDTAAIPAARLPFEAKPRPDAAFVPEVVSVAIDDELLRRIEAAAGGDMPSFLLTAWQIVVSRLSGQNEVVIGEESDGRHLEEFGNALGLLSKALPYCGIVKSEVTFSEALAETRRARDQAIAFQDSLEPVGRSFPVGFSIENRTAPQPTGQLYFSNCGQHSYTDHFHIQLRGLAKANAWFFELVYDSNYFRRDVVERFSQEFQLFLTAVTTEPNSAISGLTTMQSDERHRILVDFNATAADFPRDKSIHQLFETQVERTPERAALRCGDLELTYAELNARANQLAHLLRKRGVTANVAVGLCVERSTEMIVGLLGILKAGGCYVPLIPDSPKARMSHQLQESAALVVITETAFLGHLPEFAGEIVCLDRDGDLLDKEAIHNPEQGSSPDDLVYVIYTSGSTGTPKGVAVQHSNLVNYANFVCRLLDVEQHPDGLAFATVSTISADLGNTSIFPALISGGCLHILEQETAMAANLFAAYTAVHPIDVLKITPSHMTTLLSVAEGQYTLPLKYLILGGEPSSWDLVERVRHASNCTIINHYGPTETTVGCCTYIVQENDVTAWSPATVPIGRPIANDHVYILDRHLQPTNIGVPGELCVGGAGVAKGYLNQPQQTAERFVQDPFSQDPAARMYKTGDLARFLPDGNVEFLGRIDQQVKIRGFRVEPAEIESILREHPTLNRVAVVPYDDKSGEKRLAAYFVSMNQPATEELREFLLQRLPNYMVPSAFIPLTSLPLTPNGKVDLRSLPSPEENQAKAERRYIAPSNPTEEQLVNIWSEVLKIEAVSVEDNFFELGGHSLLATQIISRIRNGFRVQMPLHSFLETPTIIGLAEKISQCPPAESEEEEMARLLQELEGLSDEEAELLLAADSSNNSVIDQASKPD